MKKLQVFQPVVSVYTLLWTLSIFSIIIITQNLLFKVQEDVKKVKYHIYQSL